MGAVVRQFSQLVYLSDLIAFASNDPADRLLELTEVAFRRTAPGPALGVIIPSLLKFLRSRGWVTRYVKVVMILVSRLIKDCGQRPGFLVSQAVAAHGLLLEALAEAGSCGLQRDVLDLLWKVEWRIALHEAPPMSGVFFGLARVHHQALIPPAPLYHSWTSREGIEAEWEDLHRMGPVDPVFELMLLGLAAVNGAADFVDRHADAVGEVVANVYDPYTRCEQFRLELEELQGVLDEEARVQVIAPWLDTMERVIG